MSVADWRAIAGMIAIMAVTAGCIVGVAYWIGPLPPQEIIVHVYMDGPR